MQTVFEGGVPFRSWALPSRLEPALREAQLVLIDSPAFPPSREHALLTALGQNRGGLIVLDDANIPTVQRFCARLANTNQLASLHSPVDHGLFFILPPKYGGPILSTRGILETLKAWRRFLWAMK